MRTGLVGNTESCPGLIITNVLGMIMYLHCPSTLYHTSGACRASP
jgi:hypothetical protein